MILSNYYLYNTNIYLIYMLNNTFNHSLLMLRYNYICVLIRKAGVVNLCIIYNSALRLNLIIYTKRINEEL